VPKEREYGTPELPVPTERDDGRGPELPVSRQSVLPELPTPKEPAFARPELPTPKGPGTELPTPKGPGTELPTPKAHMEELPELPLLRGVRELPTPKTSTSRSAAPGQKLAEPSLSLPELPAPRLGHADLPVLREVDGALEDEGLGRDAWDSLLDADQDAFRPDLPARVYGDDAQLPGSSGDTTTGPGLPAVDDLGGASAQDLLDEALGETDGLLGDLSLSSSGEVGALDFDLDLDSASLPAVEPSDDDDLTDSLFESIGPPGEAISIPAPPALEPEAGAPPVPEEEKEDVWSRRRRQRRERREQRQREAETRAPAARQKPARRAPARSFSGSRILIALLALLAVVVLVLQVTGFFDLPNPDEYAGPMRAATPQRRPAPEEQTPVDVTRAVELSFDTLRAGDFGSYLTFIQQASNAAAATDYRDQNAVARLLVGQTLMAIQYGEQARMVEGMAGRASVLTDADSPLQALAKGAVAAYEGDVETARELLSDVTEAEYAAWASLFEGLAAFQRYQLDVEAFERARSEPIEEESLEPTPEGAEPPEGADASAEGGEGEGPESQDEPLAARPVLDEAAAEAFELAARRDPQLVVAPYFLGRFHLLSGDAEAAVRAFSQALEASPVHIPSQIGLSRALVELGRFEEASRRLVQALEPDNTAGTEHERAHLHALRGRVALVRQRYDEALAAFQRAYVEDPSNTEVIWTLTDLFARSGGFDEGVRFFEQNSAPEAESAEISLALAALKLGLAQGQDEEVKAVTLDEVYQSLEGGRGAHPDDGRFAYYLARVREAQNRFEESRLLFEEALEVDPDNPLPHLGLTDLARLSNQSEEAVAHLEQAMEAAAGDAGTLTRIGQRMEALERPDLAAEAFRRAVEADPALVEAHFAMVRLLLSRSASQQALEQALSELELVEDFGVDDAELHSLFAEVHYRLGHLNTARERMERAAERQDSTPRPDQSFLMGRINFDAGQAEVGNDPSRAREFFLAAREDFQRAYMGGTDSAAPYFWEGRAYFELGEYEQALTGFRGAIDGLERSDEGNGEYHYWQGRALEALGQNAQAVESYLVVDLYDLQWALDHPDVYFRRGRLLLHQARRLRAAKRDLRWALVLDPQNAAAAAELGEIHYRQERFQRAIELWNRSLRIDPGQAEIHYRLGSTYYNRLDEPELAVRHLEQAIEMGYGNHEPEIYQMLGYLYRDAPGRSHDGQAITMFRRYLESGAADQNRDLRIEVENQIRRLGGRI
jgi:tetratricopeptide (TPR) repeat protein